MRVEWTDGVLNVWFRQSWLDTYLQKCQEQSRFKLVNPEGDSTTDAALLGTAVHAGIEHALRGCDDYVECVAESRKALALRSEEETVRYVDMTYRQAHDAIPDLLASWWRFFRQRVQAEGVLAVEHKFEILFDEYDERHEHEGAIKVKVFLEGQIDCITRKQVWDWKTAGQTYKGWEKQRWAIQPTAYSAVADCDPQFPLSYPIDFTYGIMLKGGKEPTQTVTVVRRPEHNAWLRRQLRQIVTDRALNGYPHIDSPSWQLTDSHVFCSPKWCGYWSDCKGQYITDEILRNVA